ncbi:MAG: hypothetical protein WAM14_24275 [Candidatus Nitrosopolaris sp.]
MPKISSVLGGHLPNYIIGIDRTPVYGKNEITPTPNQTAPYNTGYIQGFIGTPFKGHHT